MKISDAAARIARFGNVLLGAWLYFSAFVWFHTAQQYRNALVVGALATGCAIIGSVLPRARYLNTVLAAWLVISAWSLPRAHAATLWNSLLVGMAMLLISLVGLPGPRAPERSGMHRH